MLTLPPALAALGAWPQFVCWFAQPKTDRPDKLDKFPVDWRTGQVVGINDRDAWTTPDNALAVHAAYDRGWGSGAGFVFTADDPFFFADIDGAAVTDAAGATAWSPLAQSVLARFPGAAVELSHSGRGLHIFGRAAPMPHGKRNVALNLELYTEGRFCALTGTGALGDAGTEHTEALAAYVAEYFPARASGAEGVGAPAAASAGWTTEPCAEWSGPTDDDELIRRMLASGLRQTAAQAFGGAGVATLRQLWEADADALAAQWPGEGAKPYNASSADMALANHLAWWTGRDCARMERLMLRSGLAREKWETHRTYLVDTITQAAGFIRGCLTDTPRAPDAVSAVHAGRTLRAEGREYVSAFDQIEHFEGCYYLAAQERVYSFKHDMVLGKAAFDVLFGGHLFPMDALNGKPTASAWEAFTLSRVNVPLTVHATCFRPELLSGAVITEGRRQLVNAYVPHEPRVLDGDPSPFLNHLAKMLPVERDRDILLHWMARVAQSPGRKLQWWPIIQGVQGNGKSSILRVMAYLAGREHTHLVNVETMAKTGGQFNSWIRGKTFLGLEEIKVEDRRHFLNVLKPYVTEDSLPLEGKGVNQETGDNRANGVGTTNYIDGMPIDDKERRYGMFVTAQQEEEHLERDGMTSRYFSDLRDWWRGEGAYAAQGRDYGLAVVAGYLRSYALSAELDPAHHSRAPRTSSHGLVVTASMGRVEQEILEAIDEGRPGFAGGWVSSIMLDRLMHDMRGNVPRNKRRDLLATLGYEPHPALAGGRVNETVTPDNGKPVLYVRRGHLRAQLSGPKAVAEAYSRDQMTVVAGAAFRA